MYTYCLMQGSCFICSNFSNLKVKKYLKIRITTFMTFLGSQTTIVNVIWFAIKTTLLWLLSVLRIVSWVETYWPKYIYSINHQVSVHQSIKYIEIEKLRWHLCLKFWPFLTLVLLRLQMTKNIKYILYYSSRFTGSSCHL